MYQALLKTSNDFTRLQTNHPDLHRILWQALRFRERNYWFSPAYKSKVWDGFKNFYSKESGRFLTGLLPEVEAALKHLSVEYKIVDERTKIPLKYTQIDKNFLSEYKKNSSPIILEDYQVDHVNQALKTNSILPHRGIILAPTACHGKGQKILMYNGDLKVVENIKVGDLLMGPDSKPRTVMEIHNGTGELYKVKPHRGKSFIVNKNHILTLISTPQHLHRYSGEIGGKIVDVSVEDYIKKSNWYKHIFKLFSSDGVNFNKHSRLPIDPYFLGVLLGDGSLGVGPKEKRGSVGVTTVDDEIIKEIKKQADMLGLEIRVSKASKQRPSTYYFKSNIWHYNKINILLDKLKLRGKTSHNKFVPEIYKTSSRKNRLKLLAGIIDSIGYYNKHMNHYEITLKSEKLFDDILNIFTVNYKLYI